jgi:hypothetical protein
VETDLVKEAVMGNVVERLSKAICGHVFRANVLKLYMTVTDPVLNVVVVDIDVFGMLVVALSLYELY